MYSDKTSRYRACSRSFIPVLSFVKAGARFFKSYRSVVNYFSIISHINRSRGASFAFLHDYDVYLAKRAVRRILGDRVAPKESITV